MLAFGTKAGPYSTYSMYCTYIALWSLYSTRGVLKYFKYEILQKFRVSSISYFAEFPYKNLFHFVKAKFRVYVYVHVYICVCVIVRICTCICIFTCICICYVYVYMYMYMLCMCTVYMCRYTCSISRNILNEFRDHPVYTNTSRRTSSSPAM